MTNHQITALNDRKQLDDLRAGLQLAVSQTGRQTGLEIKVGNISYEASGDRCTVKITVALDGAESKEAQDFKRSAFVYDLKAEALGATFKRGVSLYTIIGLKPRATKRPIICEDENGKKTVWPAESIVRQLLSHTATAELVQRDSSYTPIR